MAKDYYQILGVDKNASPPEIKAAFRRLAHQHHPDKAGGDEQKFKEINEAYQVLSDEKKRQQYDQFGQTFEQARAQGGFAGFEGFRDFADFASAFKNGNNGQNFSFEFGDLGDIFGDLFGFSKTRTRTRGRTPTGANIEVELTIDFRQAIFGTQKSIVLNKDEECSKCHGGGVEPGAKILTCPQCHGTGRVMRSIGFGISFANVCPVCQGTGQKGEKDCSQCHGSGVIRTQRTISVKIPAGIDNGQTIRLAGEGQDGSYGGRAGDLYIRIKVMPDKEFVRQGYDIFSQKEINFAQAALGAKVDINTLEGEVKLKIPAGTQGGKIFRLAGRGVPRLNSRGRGDQLVKIIVKTPQRLSRRQKELLEELGKEGL